MGDLHDEPSVTTWTKLRRAGCAVGSVCRLRFSSWCAACAAADAVVLRYPSAVVRHEPHVVVGQLRRALV